jgi:hypothetical protein
MAHQRVEAWHAPKSVAVPKAVSGLPVLAFVVACSSGSFPREGEESAEPVPSGLFAGAAPATTLDETLLIPVAEPARSTAIVIKANPEGRTLPLLGGTLLITASGRWAVAAHPDHGLVSVVDLAQQKLTQQLNLGATASL